MMDGRHRSTASACSKAEDHLGIHVTHMSHVSRVTCHMSHVTDVHCPHVRRHMSHVKCHSNDSHTPTSRVGMMPSVPEHKLVNRSFCCLWGSPSGPSNNRLRFPKSSCGSAATTRATKSSMLELGISFPEGHGLGDVSAEPALTRSASSKTKKLS